MDEGDEMKVSVFRTQWGEGQNTKLYYGMDNLSGTQWDEEIRHNALLCGMRNLIGMQTV